MTCAEPIKQTPTELLNWSIDWSVRGLGEDTIATSTWVGSSDAFTISDESHTDTMTTMFLTGGVADSNYTITNTITTNGGLTMQETAEYDCIAQRIITCQEC